MQTTICDIPCNVVVTSFTPWKPATFYGEDEGEIIGEVQDLEGNPAPEIAAMMTPFARNQLERELIAQCTHREEDY